MRTEVARRHPTECPLPAGSLDLLDRPLPSVLVTDMPDGRLQASVVWCNRAGDHVLLNTMREFQKARNLRRSPRATVFVPDPVASDRWIEVRGRVELEEHGASDHLDELARLYAGTAPYFGAVVPAELAAKEHPIRIRLVPAAVRTGPFRVSGGRRTNRPVPAGWDRRRACGDEPPIPPTHRDLFERPLTAVLATRLLNGFAQVQPVWFEPKGNDLLVNTTRERAKGRNLEADPRATLLVIDPADDGRWIEVRGAVDLIATGAEAELDRVTRRYTRYERFYGWVYPVERRELETRVIARIHPRRIVCDAIH
jgi:PPOX class probable F420-dependent enzyme